jgi:hypothetical protein
MRLCVAFALAGAVAVMAADPPVAEISNEKIRATVYLPDAGKANPVGNVVENNILYSPTSPRGSILTYAANAVKSDYNVVVNRFSINGGTTDLTLTQWRMKTGQDTHSILSTPTALFVDPVNNNYQLKPGSPAIDAGATLTQVTDDITGKPRSLGGYDIGAYESF